MVELGISGSGMGAERRPLPAMLTVEQVAAILAVTPYTTREWLKAGLIPGQKVGRLWRVSEQEFRLWVERHGRARGGASWRR